MNLKEEDVFLVLLEAKLRKGETSGFISSYAQIALALKDATAEIISVTNKMSKSSVTTNESDILT